MLIRKFYLNKITKYLDHTSLIKVLVGQRRVGKSYIMRQLINFLKEEKNVSPDNIIYVNLEIDFLKYNSIQDLDKFIQNKIKKRKGRVYLFVDEIQEINGWEKLINSYRANENLDIDIYITGSNASLLSSELASHLSGRYINFEIFPFSYKEFLEYFNLQNTKEIFLNYLNFSGIAELYKLPDEETKSDFIRILKDTIILRDIVKRFKLKEVNLLEDLFLFCLSNISNLLSINSIVKKLKSQGIKTNTITIGNYLKYLENTFILHSCTRYDLQGRKILEGEKKYYLNDLGFKNYLLSNYDYGLGKELENLVYIYFKRLGYKVYTGKLGNLEIDFIIEKGKERKYIQVAYLIADRNVFNREFGNLLKIPDNYEKIVLSLDDITTDNYQGIRHFKIWEYLAKF